MPNCSRLLPPPHPSTAWLKSKDTSRQDAPGLENSHMSPSGFRSNAAEPAPGMPAAVPCMAAPYRCGGANWLRVKSG